MDAVRLLVVDDEKDVRRSLTDYFEDEGFTVFAASSAEEGWEILDSNSVDVCVVDMRLPGCDGNEFIAVSAEKFKNMKFLVYTGSTAYGIPGELLSLGMSNQDVFNKPVDDMSIILNRINELLKD